MSEKNIEEVAAQIDGIFDQMDRRGWERHLQDDCTLLDDRCCVRGWQHLRKTHPLLVADVELLHGKDFWKRLPTSLRTMIAVFLTMADHTDEEARSAVARGLRAAAEAMEEEKVRAVRRGRAARNDPESKA